MSEPVIKGDGWMVLPWFSHRHNRHSYGVFGGALETDNACQRCAEQAHAGNPNAIAAVLMCPDDPQLQAHLRRLSGG